MAIRNKVAQQERDFANCVQRLNTATETVGDALIDIYAKVAKGGCLPPEEYRRFVELINAERSNIEKSLTKALQLCGAVFPNEDDDG